MELRDLNSTQKLAVSRRKKYNCGVYSTGEGDIKNDYYGILMDIVQIEYVGEPLERCVLFSCEWFDPALNYGTQSHKLSKVIEVHRTRRY